MLELDATGWLVVSLCAALVGMAKTGAPGITVLVVPLMAGVLPARSSVGVLLGMLILGDLFAAGYYRRHAQWGHMVRLLPATFVGIVASYFLLSVVSDQQLKSIIGAIVLAMLAVTYWRTATGGKDAPIPTKW